MPKPTLVCCPSIKTPRRPAHRTLLLRFGDGRCDRDRYRLCDLVLHGKDVGEIAVIALGPDMIASPGLNKLRRDPDAVSRFAQTAFEHIADPKLPPDLLHVDCAALVGEAG